MITSVLPRSALVCLLVGSTTLPLAAAQLPEKKGSTPYVTHFIFRPVQGLDVSCLGNATLL
jgi:hypothetical protein